MRLHRLTLSAFGPFAGTTRIDFDRLATGGVFLLHGPTGAGKTAVLDAVCYALYGSVPGSRQQHLPALRSHHAAPDTPTEVTLDLTVEGRRLEVTRRPEQTRPKKRGQGHTTDKAVTRLREFDTAAGQWRGISRSHQETALELGRLLGMNREQFCQVVLLPQGDFARFLRAGAEDRARLLGRLFDTGRFAAAESHLAELRSRAQQQLQSGDNDILALVHRMRQAAGDFEAPVADSFPAEAGDPRVADASLELAAHLRSAARERLDIAGIAVHAAEERHRAARHRHAETLERARLQQEYERARLRAEVLEQRGAGIARDREALDRARAADTVTTALEAREAAARAHAAACAAESVARAALDPGLREAALEALEADERTSRRELGVLASARRAEERALRLSSELDRLDVEDAEDAALLAETAASESAGESEVAAAQERLAASRQAAETARARTADVSAAEERLAAALRAQALAEDLRAQEEEHLARRHTAATAYETWLERRELRLRGYAAELAATLEPGDACAVCGATSHPEPAAPGERQVSAEAEEEARLAHQAAEEQVRSSARRVAELRAEHSGQAARSGSWSVPELTAAADAVRAERDAARSAAARTEADRAALSAAESHLETARGALRRLRERGAARIARRASWEAERETLLDDVTDARRGAASVSERARGLEERTERIAVATAAVRAATQTGHQSKEEDARAADAAYRAGFTTPAEAAAAHLPAELRRRLQAEVDAHLSEEATLRAVLTDARIRSAAGEPPADPVAAEAAERAALAQLRDATARESSARSRRESLDALSRTLIATLRAQGPLQAENRRVTRLAQLTAGTAADNAYRMRLETYVLTARLEQVAQAATGRLRHMSAGRYTLTHTDTRTGRSRSGLGLRVTDAWTGRDRDTATLSGGESFTVSLALALGLADVVAEEAGGRRLDTLFVDEGFGTLDEEALDDVLDVLDGLREQERAVGIVSHVPELRFRLPVRLEISKRRDGSVARHHTGSL